MQLKLSLPLILTAFLVGCGTPSTQKPLLERTLKRDTYYCVQSDLKPEDSSKIKAIEKVINIPSQDEMFKKIKGTKDYTGFSSGSWCGTYPYPSTAYFKWIDLSTGKIYEETANLQEALEGLSVHNGKLIFRISENNELFVYLQHRGKDADLKPKNWPKDPYMDIISEYKFWQLHPQPSPTKGLK